MNCDTGHENRSRLYCNFILKYYILAWILSFYLLIVYSKIEQFLVGKKNCKKYIGSSIMLEEYIVGSAMLNLMKSVKSA